MAVTQKQHGKAGNLGTVRLHHEHTHEIILIPTPSSDPKDPLNWPQWYKYYIAGLSSWAILLSTFCAAGPAVVLSNMAITFFGPPGPHFAAAIQKSSYFITVCALMMGVSNVVWVPLMVKVGRRPVYIFAYAFYCGTAAWCACAKSYSSMLAARALLGCAAGAAEVLGPLTIADIFFVHERGTMMVIYTCMLSAGTSLGSIISGLITIHNSWRDIFWVSCSLTGATAVLMFLTLPETIYKRDVVPVGEAPGSVHFASVEEKLEDGQVLDVGEPRVQRCIGERPSFNTVLTTRPTAFTSESVWKLSVRPLALIVLPSALWASLVMAVSIGFLVAMSSNVSTAYSTYYGFSTWQIGLTLIAGIVGSVSAIWFGGPLSDRVADYLTAKNGGIREPEFRLPAMAISVITGPLALILYGVGIGKHLHWICPAIGLGLINFTIVQAANISVVYMIDCYRPIAGEVTMTQYTFKSLLGFLLSFYTNAWVQKSGYVAAFGEMAAISGAVLLSFVFFYFYGKALRRRSWHWPIMRMCVHWRSDREVGE